MSFNSIFGSSKPLPKASEAYAQAEKNYVPELGKDFPNACDKKIRQAIKEGKTFCDCDRLSGQHRRYLHELGYYTENGFQQTPMQEWFTGGGRETTGIWWNYNYKWK